MRTYRLAVFALIALGALAVTGCTKSGSPNETEAPVFLSTEVPSFNPEVSISVPADVTIATLTISSHAKSPSVTLSPQQDVVLDQWVITSTRSDGGTVASPTWQYASTVYVPAGGSANVLNGRVFPAEFFGQLPLVNLLPSNGGLDPETGQPTIRQKLHIEAFGKTVAGQKISVAFDLNYKFAYLFVPAA